MDKNIKIAPSILAANALSLGEDVKKVEDAGAEYLHIDIMDGHFVPNLSFSPDTVRALRKVSNLVFDVHLMISEPRKYIRQFAEAGADIITIHKETTDDASEMADFIHSFGVKAGISVKPETDIESIRGFIDKYDLVLIMTVEPGFGGQSYMEEMNEKILKARKIIDELGLQTELEVDGGVTVQNVNQLVSNGANVIVAGSAIFKAEDIEKTIMEMRSAVLCDAIFFPQRKLSRMIF